jgi:hypothetical protein
VIKVMHVCINVQSTRAAGTHFSTDTACLLSAREERVALILLGSSTAEAHMTQALLKSCIYVCDVRGKSS